MQINLQQRSIIWFWQIFYIVCTVHSNQLYKQTNKMHFLYIFIQQFLYNSTCFERPFRSSSGVHDLLYLQLSTSRANVFADTFARLVLSCRYSKSWTPDDERNGRSKHVELYKNCWINTYRKYILLVCLYNWFWHLTASIVVTVCNCAFQELGREIVNNKRKRSVAIILHRIKTRAH